MHFTHYLLLFYNIFNAVESANIFGVFPMPMKSHQIVFSSIIKALAERGHNLTIITPDPIEHDGKYPNLNQIDVHDISYSTFDKYFNFSDSSSDLLTSVFMGLKAAINVLEAQLREPRVKQILEDPSKKYDVCLIECWFEIMFAFKDHLNCSLILISSTTGSFPNYDAFGNPSNPTLFMELISPYFGNLSFWERIVSVYTNVVLRFFYYYYIVPKYDSTVKNHFGKNIRSVSDIHNDADMLFVYGHPMLSGNRPNVPGIIHLDNLHIKPVNHLPENLEKLLNDSAEDVIYFSFGSTIKISSLKESLINHFLDAFRELPYRVLMKWENGTLPNQPKNVHIFKWMPQQDILAHPKVKAFITQGGHQSFEEAIYYKVPMIGLPFVFDQIMNIKKIEKFGIGIGMDMKSISKEQIKSSILKIMQDQSFKKNIENLLNLINDQPEKSLERAVWWIEYVIRHNGAKHLKSAAAEVSFAKYFLLDVITFFLITTMILIWIFKSVLGFLSEPTKKDIKKKLN